MRIIFCRVVNGPRGCTFVEGVISQGIRSGSGIVFAALFQPALFCLMCYPMLTHILKRRKALGIANEENQQKTTKSLGVGETKIHKIIRRLMISLILVTISDVGAVIGAFLLQQYPVFYIGLVYDVNITFGAYVITWSFKNWRQRIVPFYQIRKKRPAETLN